MGNNTTYAYARVSTAEQSLGRQLEAFSERGVDPSNVFADKMSGAKASRPELDRLLETVRPGDTVVVMSFDRLARSTKQLLELSERFEREGVSLVSLKENLDTSTPQGKLFFTISAAFAEFERSIIRERQAEGIRLAKQAGRYEGRRPDDYDHEALAEIAAAQDRGEVSGRRAAELLGMSERSYRRRKAALLAG